MEQFKYRIDFTINNKPHWPIEIQSNVDFRNSYTKEYIDEMIKYFILSTVNIGEYKGTDNIFTRNITFSIVEGQTFNVLHSSDRTLQIYPRLNK